MLSAPPAFVLSQDQTLMLEFDSKLYLLPFYRKVRSLAFTFYLVRNRLLQFVSHLSMCSHLVRLFHCTVFKDHSLPFFAATEAILSQCFELVNTFFKFL